MKTRMTGTAWGQGFANMLICGVGVVGIFLAVRWLVSITSDCTPAESRELAFAVIWIGCILGFIASWIHGFSRRGSRLLDCGGHPTRWLFIIVGVRVAIEGIGASFARINLIGQSGTLFALSFSVYWMIMGLGRLEIYEHGIWTYWSLTKWSRIRDYSWAEDGTLLIRGSGPLSFLWRGAIPVPNECLAAFKLLLEQRLPATSAR